MNLTPWQWIQAVSAATRLGHRWLHWRVQRRRARIERAARDCADLPTETETPDTEMTQ